MARSRYEDGYKYCSRCRLYYKTPAPRCPSCKSLLRAGPRKKRQALQKATVQVEVLGDV